MIGSGRLKDYFEKIYIISLPEKVDRLHRLEANLQSIGLAMPGDIEVRRAVSGKACPPPHYFRAGAGAWGCLQSHLRIVQDATMDRLQSILILEDDVVFHSNASQDLTVFMDQIPSHWDQLYLGGQHLVQPKGVEGSPFVFRCRNINRTHAYALNSNVFERFQQHIAHAPDYVEREGWHVDHQLGLAHERENWSVYAPVWWLAGQEEGESSIRGCPTPRCWWHYEGFSRQLPFVLLPETPPVDQWRQLRQHLHLGNNLKPRTLEDCGLDACLDAPEKLQEWLRMIAREALDHWKIPALSHPKISRSQIQSLWPGGVYEGGVGDLERLSDYPGNGLIRIGSEEAGVEFV